MPLKIPKTFQLANRTWTVRVEDFVGDDAGKTWGQASADECTIQLCPKLFEAGREELLAHIWEHELMHALLFAHGIVADDHDETFVHGMAALRCQLYQTAAGDGTVQPDKKKAPRRRPK